MRRILLQLMLLVLPFAAWAQDACYLIGTDKVMEANHASVTLEKQKDGVFAGEVNFQTDEFTITTQLGTDADGWNRIRNYRWGPLDAVVFAGQDMVLLKYNKTMQNFHFYDFKDDQTYWVKVTFESSDQARICIYNDKTDDPDNGSNNEDDNTEVPDIDLSTGAHFTVTLPEAGSLQQRLTNAVFQTDEDLVDFLTVKGKMGSEDLKYLIAQKGLVSQLKYLDLSDVELVYDDQEYYGTSGSNGLGSGATQTVCYLSAENREEHREGIDMGSMQTVFYHKYWSNDLAYAFSNMKNLKQIKLPKTLTGVGAHILDGTPIEKVTLPTAPVHIGEYAFYLSSFDYEGGCKLKAFDLPESVDSLAAYALEGIKFRTIDVSRIAKMGEGCFSNTNVREAVLSNNLKRIPNKAFIGCSKLATVTIPGSVGTIGERAFQYCGLTSVVMEDGVRIIGPLAFDGNRKLASVTAPNTLEEIGSHAFNGWGEFGVGVYDTPYIANLPADNGVKYIGNVAYLFMGGDELTIKEGTLGVADDFLDNHNMGGDYQWGHSAAFSGWTAPATVTLPSTLRTLGAYSLRNTGISSIELPEALEKLGTDAFAECSKLRRVTIPASVKSIGQGVFYHTGLIRVYYNAVDAEVLGSLPVSLTRAIIGEGVKTIPAQLFSGCSNLARVQMPSTVERIGDYAFSGCTSLTHIDLPSSLTTLGKEVFEGCTASFSAYMKKPIFMRAHPSDEEILNREQYAIEHGYAQTNSGAVATPFGGNLYYTYHIDEQGNLTWDDEGRSWWRSWSSDPLTLQVPNGSLEEYQNDEAWSTIFSDITTFDGASDTEAVEETTTVSVSETVTDGTDLTGTLLGGVYVTLDTEDSGDGYNATEGCIVINSTVSDDQLAAATADDADDLTVKNQFNGLIFEVPAGRGSIVIDCQTLGQQAVYVKIGQSEPQQVETAERSQATIPYEVSEPTRIYVYAAPKGTAAARQNTSDEPLLAPRRAAYANDDAVKLYGLTINVDENLSAISTPTAAMQATDGVRKVTQHGRLYILLPDGRKYSVEGVRQNR